MTTDFLTTYPALAAMEAVPLFSALGCRFRDAAERWAELLFEASAKTDNLYGITHGGAWLFLADSAMGAALGTLCVPAERVITTQSDFRWLRALEGRTIVARGEVMRRGRSVSHCRATLIDEAGRVVGAGTGTYVILPG
jgi:uncharacterized protein (TIGR00369 family)